MYKTVPATRSNITHHTCKEFLLTTKPRHQKVLECIKIKQNHLSPKRQSGPATARNRVPVFFSFSDTFFILSDISCGQSLPYLGAEVGTLRSNKESIICLPSPERSTGSSSPWLCLKVMWSPLRVRSSIWAGQVQVRHAVAAVNQGWSGWVNRSS